MCVGVCAGMKWMDLISPTSSYVEKHLLLKNLIYNIAYFSLSWCKALDMSHFVLMCVFGHCICGT